MMDRYAREIEIALQAVRKAAVLCQNVQHKIGADALEKKDRSPVTVADFGSQAIICKALSESFPDDFVIAEENSAELKSAENSAFLDRIQAELASIDVNASGEQICNWIDHGFTNQYHERFWTLDPIDGTKGFLRGEQYAISLALVVDGQLQLGLLGCPNLTTSASSLETGALFFAVSQEGAYVVPLADEAASPSRVTVSETATPSAARLCESVESGHSSHGWSARIAESLGITQEPARLDSQAKYATVARGEADVYLRLPTRADYTEKIWDHAGGVLVVQEAGGTVTDIDGKPLEFNHGRELAANRGVVVSNGHFHDSIIEAVHSAANTAESGEPKTG